MGERGKRKRPKFYVESLSLATFEIANQLASQLFKEHLAGACQKPLGTYAILRNHRLEPRHLKPPPIQIFALSNEIAAVNIVKAAIGVHTPYALHSDNRIKGAIETLYDLLAYRGVHFKVA